MVTWISCGGKSYCWLLNREPRQPIKKQSEIEVYSHVSIIICFDILPFELCQGYLLNSIMIDCTSDIYWILHVKICIPCSLNPSLLPHTKDHQAPGWYRSSVNTGCDTDFDMSCSLYINMLNADTSYYLCICLFCIYHKFLCLYSLYHCILVLEK